MAIATLPIVIVGFLAKDVIDSTFRSISVIATTTLVFGLALWYADSRPQQQKTLTFPAALLIGLAQCIALIPHLALRYNDDRGATHWSGRTQSARFSFLLAIPTIFGAQLLMMLDLSVSELLSDAWDHVISAATLAGLSAYVCIHFSLRWWKRTGHAPLCLLPNSSGAYVVFYRCDGLDLTRWSRHEGMYQPSNC